MRTSVLLLVLGIFGGLSPITTVFGAGRTAKSPFIRLDSRLVGGGDLLNYSYQNFNIDVTNVSTYAQDFTVSTLPGSVVTQSSIVGGVGRANQVFDIGGRTSALTHIGAGETKNLTITAQCSTGVSCLIYAFGTQIIPASGSIGFPKDGEFIYVASFVGISISTTGNQGALIARISNYLSKGFGVAIEHFIPPMFADLNAGRPF